MKVFLRFRPSLLRLSVMPKSQGEALCSVQRAAMAVAAASKVPKQVIKSPSMALSYMVALSSLLTGAAVVHNIFKPDLTIPEVSSQSMEKESGKIST